MNWSLAKAVLEALVFASSEPVTAKEIGLILELNEETVYRLIDELIQG